MSHHFTESVVEEAALAILRDALLPKLLSMEWCVDVGVEETEAIA